MRQGFSPSHGTNTSPPLCRQPRRPELLALGAAVRELRARRGWSQEHLGFRADLHRNYIGGIERGELNITFRVLLKLARGLRIPLSELIGIYERNRAATAEVVAPREREPR
jgi:transcriptional regulator with XRE-family HTH domain